MKCKALRCIYYNEGNGYTVASYVTEEALPEKVSTQKNSQYGMFTAVGNELPTEEGLEVELNGTWKDGKFGMQYKVSSFQVVLPTNTEGIKAYNPYSTEWPTKYIALAYLTGILPIKKMKTQSALNNFDEFTMLSAGNMAPYVGFTESEVKMLAKKYHQNYEKVKRWYDGYLLNEHQIYNPWAVVGVMLNGEFKSYWSETASYETIVPLINMDFDGLKSAVIEMLSGAEVKVNTETFKNDTVNIQNRDEVLTYMIHLGYLGYDQNRRSAFVPNEEIRQELTLAVREIVV